MWFRSGSAPEQKKPDAAGVVSSRMSWRRATPALLALSVTLLTIAWVIGNPPSAAPDEVAHYVKALGAGSGDLVGRTPSKLQVSSAVKSEAKAMAAAGEPAANAVKIAAWQWRTTRLFQVPAGSLSTAFGCADSRADLSWACINSGTSYPSRSQETSSYIGTYPPFVYVPSGLLAHAASNPETRLWLGRAGMAALALVMLIAAFFVLFDGDVGGLSLVGLLLAVTPMVLFVSSTLSASGPEVASAICFVASLLRLSRSKRSPWWVWAVCALSGIMLALSRELGPEFIVLEILATALVLGREHVRRLAGGRRARTAWPVVALACIVAVYWDFVYNVHPPTGPGPSSRLFRPR